MAMDTTSDPAPRAATPKKKAARHMVAHIKACMIYLFSYCALCVSRRNLGVRALVNCCVVEAKAKSKSRASVRNSPPASTASTASTRASSPRVYPSIQIRAIALLDQVVAEAQATVDRCQTFESLANMKVAQLQALHKRLCDRLDKDDSIATLTTPNKRKLEDDSEEDLGARGSAALAKASSLRDAVVVYTEVCRSLQCCDEYALEYAPEFLLRAITDAKNAKLNVPTACLGVVARRYAGSLLRDGRTKNAVSSVDPFNDCVHGMALLKHNYTLLDDAQLDMLGEILEHLLGDPGGESIDCTLKHLFDSLASAIRRDETKAIVAHARAVFLHADSDTTDDAIQNAVAFFTPGPASVIPDKVARLFSSGQGKTLLFDARRWVLQKQIDSGRLLTIIFV